MRNKIISTYINKASMTLATISNLKNTFLLLQSLPVSTLKENRGKKIEQNQIVAVTTELLSQALFNKMSVNVNIPRETFDKCIKDFQNLTENLGSSEYEQHEWLPALNNWRGETAVDSMDSNWMGVLPFNMAVGTGILWHGYPKGQYMSIPLLRPSLLLFSCLHNDCRLIDKSGEIIYKRDLENVDVLRTTEGNFVDLYLPEDIYIDLQMILNRQFVYMFLGIDSDQELFELYYNLFRN